MRGQAHRWDRSSRGAIVGALAALAACVVLMPDAGFLIRGAPIRLLPVGLDSGLGVPALSVFFAFPESALEPGDRVLAVRTAPEANLITLDTRDDLLRVLKRPGVGERVELSVRRSGRTLSVSVPVVTREPVTRVLENWPLALAGLIYLFVALAALAGGRHPVVTPMFVGSLCIGVALLGSFDAVIPEDPGLLGFGQLRARAALLCFTLLPAVVLHFSMRFPVVHPRFRQPALAASAYVVFAVPCAVAQLRFYDADIVQAIELLAQLMTLLALGGLLVLTLLGMSRLKPIERSRAAALLAGGGFAALGPLAMLLAGSQPARNVTLFVAFCVLAPPLALSWAVARYRLLDPPRWLGKALSATLILVAAFLIAAATMRALPRELAGPEAPHAYALGMTLLAVGFYQGLRLGLRRLARGRLGLAGYEEILAEATMRLTTAKSPPRALAELVDVIGKRLEPAGLELLEVEGGDAPAGPLARRGLELWKERGSPARAVVWLEVRSEDPDPQQPELVLPLSPLSGPATLLIASARADGLPYSVEEVWAFESLGQVATVAMGHAATSAELERRVDERTRLLERAARERQAIFETAQRVHVAESPRDVRLTLTRFLRSMAGNAHWTKRRPPAQAGRAVGELRGLPAPHRHLVAEGLEAPRAAEIQPQLETVCAFAGIALERLRLVDELKREITRQAREIANITASRRHAEFVRGVAHELRKPTEEVHHVAQTLSGALEEPLALKAARIAAVTQEMNRRIDLLLFHSDLRLDLRRIDLVALVDEATRRSRAAYPGRRYEFHHELPRLPVVGDPSRLLSVVENLVDNAVKATAEGGLIRIRSRIAVASGDREPQTRACVEVEDDGVGVPLDECEDIFEPGVSHFRGGFGLGLALCREIVRGHQGDIEIESRPGRTVFRVLIPQFPEARGEEQ